jgi:DNA polymerase-3 subunit gamma/tau
MLHQVALLQLVPGCEVDEAFDAERLAGFAAQLTPEDVQLFYQIGLTGQKELHLAPDPRSGFEMLLLRMLAFRPDTGAEAAGGRSGGVAQPPARPSPAKPSAQPAASNPAGQSPVSAPAQSTPPAQSLPATPTESPDPAQWDAFAAGLKLGGITSQLASHCVFKSWDGDSLCLLLDEAHRHLRVGQAEARLQAGIADALGRPVKLKITEAVPESETPAMRQAREQQERLRLAQDEMASDPLVREMEEHFSARLVSDSVRPRD